jgi:hypothetical protein
MQRRLRPKSGWASRRRQPSGVVSVAFGVSAGHSTFLPLQQRHVWAVLAIVYGHGGSYLLIVPVYVVPTPCEVIPEYHEVLLKTCSAHSVSG